MFLLFGFGKRTTKEYGKRPDEHCDRCGRITARRFIRVTAWFTLFFIPVIPYSVKYLLVCPVCNASRQVSRDELEGVVRSLKPLEPGDATDSAWRQESADVASDWQPQYGGSREAGHDAADPDRFTGKNPTQKAYLEKLEARDRALAADSAMEALEARERALDAREKALEAKERSHGQS